MVGRERLLAGTATNSLLKVFDLRMMGGRVYSYINTDDQQSVSTPPLQRQKKFESETVNSIYDGGWNLFACPRSRDYYREHRNRRGGDSPIYSLTSPSQYSPNIYAGVEDNVVLLNFTSSSDEHPDPLLCRSLYGTKATGLMAKRTWDPVGRCPSLSMYEQGSHGDLHLMRQRPIGPLSPSDKTLPGYDERWEMV